MLVVTVCLAYLIGSVPVAVLVGRIRGVDPRLAGDGNAGWWNMRALVGKRLALAVLAGDVLKGVVAALLGGAVSDAWWAPFVTVLAAEIGHAFPVFARFEGGKAILTFVGGVTVICAPAVALALALGALVGMVRNRAALAYQVAFVAFPIMQFGFTPVTHVAATGVLMTFIGSMFLRGRRSARATPATVSPTQ